MPSKTQDKSAAKEAPAKRKGRYFYANGKRKTAVARVRLYEGGKGEVIVNEQNLADYFFGTLISNVKSPFKITETGKQFDVVVKVEGGGISAQSEAVRHGISKALTLFDPALRAALKKAGLITRDSRVKERKKFGLHGARRAPQWAKR